MPVASLQIKDNNNLEIKFNETMHMTEIEQGDIKIQIYGPEDTYSLTWIAKFTNSATVTVDLNIKTELVGYNSEKVVLEFINLEKFKSANTGRYVNTDGELSGYLKKTEASAASKSLGQTTFYIFLISIALSAVSSFGGNSMELIWCLMNTLQILYFISIINVRYPSHLENFFEYLGIVNADNEYISMFTYLFVSENKFTRGEVSEKVGDKAFFISWSDKIPILFIIYSIFILTFIFDIFNPRRNKPIIKFIMKTVDYFKYNFFLRFGMEMILELLINTLINIYFVSFAFVYIIVWFFH
jgi:hypothetical protein